VSAAAGLQAPLVTCEPVIAEACYLLRRLPAAVDAILENVEKKVFQVPLQLEAQAGAVRALLKKYARVPMDLADACLVHLAEELGTGEILTLDSDFHIYRWNRTRPFHLLVDL
jgi:predicted nucleic acid-binding protein